MAKTISYSKRKEIYKRDNFTCHYCGKKAEKIIDDNFNLKIIASVGDDWRPFELDHKIPRSNGGKNDMENLITSCAKCNNKKSNKPYNIFIKIYG